MILLDTLRFSVTDATDKVDSAAASELADKVAVVTGASSGIGRAIAIELAAAGADVILHYASNKSGVDEVAGGVRERNRDAYVVAARLDDPSATVDFVEQAWDWRGRIDIWVNNAGADVLTGAAADWSFDQKLQHLWEVDVNATISLSRIVGPRMKCAGSGVILNMGWDQAELGMAGDSGEMFAAIKGAIMAFSRSLAKSLAPQVRVNCLAPGWIKTAWGDQASDYWQQRAKGESLLQRWGTPEDVASVARFLCSPASGFVTGETVRINGGLRGRS